jgi:hypothetical protein
MVVMQMPDGTTRRYDLRASESGLRLVRPYASYDLLAMLRDAGWRIHAVTCEADLFQLIRAFGAESLLPDVPH